MSESVPRLGDTIDDYCPRCRLLLNHAVASLVDSKVVKVVCETCHSEHPYRHGEIPPKKRPIHRAALLEQVLAKAAPAPVAEPEAPEEEPVPSEPAAPKRKRSATPARYISRHKTRPPRA